MFIGASVRNGISDFRAAMGRMLLVFCGEGDSCYINGSETLPPPLTPEEEADLLRRSGGTEAGKGGG